MQTYPQELKKAAIARLCQPNGPSIRELAEELGVSTKSLARVVEEKCQLWPSFERRQR